MHQVVESKLKTIIEIPTMLDNIHQSCFRSSHILLYILDMVQRGDSEETIMDVYYFLSENGSVKK